MLSSFPKIADRNFVIAYLTPAVVAMLALLFVLRDFDLFGSFLRDALDKKKAEDLTVLVLVTWLVSVILMLANTALYRVMEGYAWPLSERQRAKSRYRLRRYDDQVRINDLFACLNWPAWSEDQRADIRRELFPLWKSLVRHFPARAEDVLPTRFGNTIRAFECYSGVVYGIEAIEGWIRLQAVIPAEYARMVDDARAKVDFFVNIWALGMIVGAVAVAQCLWALIPLSGNLQFRPFNLVVAAVACVVAAGAYEWAVKLAATWGEFIKGAFDLYLPALAKQLGYKLPPDQATRRKFWDAVNNSFIYRTEMEPRIWPPAEK